ncbi:cation diffusion facilitator, CDF family [Thermotomaculum hydrothermale]|uniref:Cation diffusion facilitator, CDF family n=1 Tax=Thermotomaculum hydrothermale TaxID=981385 RepID=A0A7R6PYA8_9BACT|nr:cation diffusion facilitator family transporter [Thermotomaculum hydrothermale]BBB33065.1 cation diffusion facilitator, CDF family [Thermotomaculum hydrothermale]
MSHNNSKSVVIVALLANLLIAASKFVVFLFTGSSSMFSEAIHSTADTGNQILLLLGMERAKKKADSTHQFGYGQEQFFWAFMVAILLFTLGGIYSIYEGIHRILHKNTIENIYLAIGLLLFSIAMESISFLKANKELKKIKGEESIFEFLNKSYQVELIVVFFEDLAAILGLIIALIFILISHFSGNTLFDGIGSILIGILLCTIAFVLGKKMKSLMIGESIPKEISDFIKKTFLEKDGIIGIVDLKSMVLGEKSMLAALEVEFKKEMTAEKIREIIDLCEKEITKKFPEVKNIYVEVRVRE